MAKNLLFIWRDMKMNEMPRYYATELGCDLCFEIALFFFKTRRNSGLSIVEASLGSKLSVNDIDELETQAGCYDFEKITKLLDFYKTKLPISARCFKRMPKKLADQYFKK